MISGRFRETPVGMETVPMVIESAYLGKVMDETSENLPCRPARLVGAGHGKQMQYV